MLIVIQPNIEINQVKINQVGNATALGVEIDDRLSWDNHIDKVSKKVTSGIGAIRKIHDLVDRETLISVYNALIKLILTNAVRYGIPWVSEFQTGFRNFKIELRG